MILLSRIISNINQYMTYLYFTQVETFDKDY